MNRSAEDGACRVRTMGTKAHGFHSVAQGVCWRHGGEETSVTQGDLVSSEGKGMAG